jgi:hypothetical protein
MKPPIAAYAALAVLTGTAGPGFAGDCTPIVDPSRSIIEYSGASTPCHYKFRTDGSGDELVVDVTVRDALNIPCPGCSVSCELLPISETLALATCCPNIVTAITDASGYAQLGFRAVSGRGAVQARVVLHCVGSIVLNTETISFTSTDLNAGAISPVGVTNLFDLGIIGSSVGTATPLAPPDVYANFNCDDAVNVFDLAFFAGGLAVDCGDAACP